LKDSSETAPRSGLKNWSRRGDAILCAGHFSNYVRAFPGGGAEQVVEILDTTRGNEGPDQTKVFIPFMALMEVEYWLLRRLSPREMETTLFLVDNWPSQVVESNPQRRHEAGRVKATASLSVADAWIAALAILNQGELVHKDPEFEQLSPRLKMLRLPYKSSPV
jgi:predicted nucleic acid-binding protein